MSYLPAAASVQSGQPRLLGAHCAMTVWSVPSARRLRPLPCFHFWKYDRSANCRTAEIPNTQTFTKSDHRASLILSHTSCLSPSSERRPSFTLPAHPLLGSYVPTYDEWKSARGVNWRYHAVNPVSPTQTRDRQQPLKHWSVLNMFVYSRSMRRHKAFTARAYS